MSRRVVVSGLGPVCAVGVGIESVWSAALAGTSGIGPIQAFDASGFACRIGAEVRDFSVTKFVPKSYRKAVKVMCRDIELAVAAADLAARDAGLVTKGNVPAEAAADGSPGNSLSYLPGRVGAHIGAGLISPELNELTAALVEARNDAGGFDIRKWGKEGINHLTPLWLLKYLPNMLACHVTIIHDAQGPSNTITCNEASSTLSIGESLRVIQRGAADACFCGGAESKLNPMVFFRQQLAGRVNTTSNPPDGDPATAMRPFSKLAAGTVVGEGGAIVILEAFDAFKQRTNGSQTQASTLTPQAYAEIVGFGASQCVNLKTRNMTPDADGRALAVAIRTALKDASISPESIDLIVPFGSAIPAYDQAEAAALRTVFGHYLPRIPVCPAKPFYGNCGAGAGGLDVCIAAKALREQTLPARLNCDQPLDGIDARTAPSRRGELKYALTLTTGLGGQNACLILKRFED